MGKQWWGGAARAFVSVSMGWGEGQQAGLLIDITFPLRERESKANGFLNGQVRVWSPCSCWLSPAPVSAACGNGRQAQWLVASTNYNQHRNTPKHLHLNVASRLQAQCARIHFFCVFLLPPPKNMVAVQSIFLIFNSGPSSLVVGRSKGEPPGPPGSPAVSARVFPCRQEGH